MKRWVLLLLIVTGVFAYYNRQLLFVRDPLGSVTRNGVAEDGAQVYINYANDVMLENDHAPMYMNLLQHGQRVGAPTAMKCIHYLLCMASGYPDPQTLPLPDAELGTMTDKQVNFRDSSGRAVAVRLH